MRRRRRIRGEAGWVGGNVSELGFVFEGREGWRVAMVEGGGG